MEEVPLLQKIFTKYSNAGLVLISVSIDEDVDALKSMVARKGIKWPQVCDGKGANSELVRAFNAQQATHFVIDRDGKVAAKHKGANGLGRIESVIARLLPLGEQKEKARKLLLALIAQFPESEISRKAEALVNLL